jgi:hypothetical protein
MVDSLKYPSSHVMLSFAEASLQSSMNEILRFAQDDKWPLQLTVDKKEFTLIFNL